MERKIIIILTVIILILTGLYLLFFKRSDEKKLLNLSGKNMKIFSSAFKNNERIPAKYTCDGENINPPLGISDTPENAKSLALIVNDPDAPRGTWTHWTIWNIDPNIREIAADSTPPNTIEGVTDFGKPGYGGPCPPSGTHRYFFKIYALDTKIDLAPSKKVNELKKAMEKHILDSAEIIGLYSR